MHSIIIIHFKVAAVVQPPAGGRDQRQDRGRLARPPGPAHPAQAVRRGRQLPEV